MGSLAWTSGPPWTRCRAERRRWQTLSSCGSGNGCPCWSPSLQRGNPRTSDTILGWPWGTGSPTAGHKRAPWKAGSKVNFLLCPQSFWFCIQDRLGESASLQAPSGPGQTFTGLRWECKQRQHPNSYTVIETQANNLFNNRCSTPLSSTAQGPALWDPLIFPPAPSHRVRGLCSHVCTHHTHPPWWQWASLPWSLDFSGNSWVLRPHSRIRCYGVLASQIPCFMGRSSWRRARAWPYMTQGFNKGFLLLGSKGRISARWSQHIGFKNALGNHCQSSYYFCCLKETELLFSNKFYHHWSKVETRSYCTFIIQSISKIHFQKLF